MSMTFNGAAGETARAMAKVLDLEGHSLDEVNRAHATLWAVLASANPQVTFEAANSLWAKLGIPFLPDFMQRNREFYGAEVTNLDFSDPQAPDTINAWVNTRRTARFPILSSRPSTP